MNHTRFLLCAVISLVGTLGFAICSCSSAGGSTNATLNPADDDASPTDDDNDDASPGADDDDDDNNDDDNDDDDLDIVWIPISAGSYEMGCSPGDNNCASDENPPHEVTLTAFQIMQTPVTQGEYVAVTGGNPSDFPTCGPDCPVESVQWADATNFCAKIGGRLPTEAEWEYAARAGTTASRYCGDDQSCLDSIAWYFQNAEGSTHPVCGKTPNQWGLCDTLGNVCEWVNDWYDAKYYSSSPTNDPQGPPTGPHRVLRGASWYFEPWDVRVSNRNAGSDVYLANALGFRCARD